MNSASNRVPETPSGRSLREILKHVGNNPPDEGDELEACTANEYEKERIVGE